MLVRMCACICGGRKVDGSFFTLATINLPPSISLAIIQRVVRATKESRACRAEARLRPAAPKPQTPAGGCALGPLPSPHPLSHTRTLSLPLPLS